MSLRSAYLCRILSCMGVHIITGLLLLSSSVSAQDYSNTEYINWENGSKVNINSGVGVPWPWNSIALTEIPSMIAMDHREEDGWVLLYNRLGTSPDDYDAYPHLMLYNKYRGIIRVFYYHIEGHNLERFIYALQMIGRSSHLNFIFDFAKPMNDRNAGRHIVKITDASLGPAGISPNHWYHFDFEVAYDSKTATYDDSDIQMLLKAWGEDKANISINGTQSGSITGTIEIPSSSNSLASIGGIKFTNSSVTNGAGQIITQTFQGNKVKQKLTEQAGEQIDKQISAAIGKAAGKLATGALSLVTGPIGNWVNSLVGGSTSSTGAVDLSMNTKLDLDGEITFTKPIFARQPLLPGAIHSGREGEIPHYDEVLGVWNLKQLPEVRWYEMWGKRTSAPPFMPPGMGGGSDTSQPFYYYTQNFKIVEDTFEPVLNPAIADELEIVSIQKKLMFYRKYDGPTKLSAGALNYLPVGNKRRVNYTKREEWYDMPQNIIAFNMGQAPGAYNYYASYPLDQRVVLKVTLKLRPKDPSMNQETIIHVKTFRPKFVKEQKYPRTDFGRAIPWDMIL